MRHHDEDRTRVGLIPFFWCTNERYWKIVHRKEGKRESRTIHRSIKFHHVDSHLQFLQVASFLKLQFPSFVPKSIHVRLSQRISE